nr:hypothetical protein [Desulforhabdus amnigena]
MIRQTLPTAISRPLVTAACSTGWRIRGELVGAGGRMLNLVDLSDVYMHRLTPYS